MLEHKSGCVALDLQPFLIILGVLMILLGVRLQRQGPRVQKSLMIIVVRLGAFLFVCWWAY